MYGSPPLDHAVNAGPTEGSSANLEKKYRPLLEDEHFKFPSHRRPSVRQHFFQGPTSAPAVAYNSEDYFSWAAESSIPLSKPSENMAVHVQALGPQPPNGTKHGIQTTRLPRRYLAHKIRHRSNLSHSYTDEIDVPLLGSLFARDDQTYVFGLEPLTAKTSLQKTEALGPKPKLKKPGFFLKLDNLNPAQSSLHKAQHQQRRLAKPVSGSSQGSAYDKMDLLESEVSLQQSSGGRIKESHDNITPLLFPPTSEDLGYFGSFDQTDISSTFETEGLPGGFLNVTSKIQDPLGNSGTSGNNSDIDSYLNFQVDDFAPGHPFDKNQFQFHGRELSEEMENTKAEAHFTPISEFHQNNAYHNTFEGNPPQNDHHSSHRLHLDHHDNQFVEDHKLDHVLNYDHNYGQNHSFNYDQLNHSSHQLNDEHMHREQFEHSYTNMPQGHEGHTYDMQRLPLQQTEHSKQYIEQVPHSSYEDYLYEKQQSYLYLELKPGQGMGGESLSDSQAATQAVESSDTDQLGTDKKNISKKRKGVKGIVCNICGKLIVRDFSRHIRIHDETGRFQCIFPSGYCKHKSRKFNRPYDYKKHLLNIHFTFDDPAAKAAPNLTEKLHFRGQCNACGERFMANEWLETHILTTDLAMKCHELQRIESLVKNY